MTANATSPHTAPSGTRLPQGVSITLLQHHVDDRGVFTELYRDEWGLGVRPAQWNAVRSRADVLRGVHVHVRHADLLTVVAGRLLVGVQDLRPGSATEGVAGLVELTADGDEGALLEIPPGVAHGFYAPEPAIHVYAVSHAFDPADELGCRWDDPEVRIPFPCSSPRLSARDTDAGSFAAMRAAWIEGQASAAR